MYLTQISQQLSDTTITHNPAIDIYSVAPPRLLQVNEFGQTPRQLFMQPHPPRQVIPDTPDPAAMFATPAAGAASSSPAPFGRSRGPSVRARAQAEDASTKMLTLALIASLTAALDAGTGDGDAASSIGSPPPPPADIGNGASTMSNQSQGTGTLGQSYSPSRLSYNESIGGRGKDQRPSGTVDLFGATTAAAPDTLAPLGGRYQGPGVPGEASSTSPYKVVAHQRSPQPPSLPNATASTPFLTAGDPIIADSPVSAQTSGRTLSHDSPSAALACTPTIAQSQARSGLARRSKRLHRSSLTAVAASGAEGGCIYCVGHDGLLQVLSSKVRQPVQAKVMKPP